MSLRRLDSAFDDFVRASSGGLLQLAYRLTGDRHAAEDLLQTALWRVARKWEAAQGNPVAYVRRTLVNLAHDDVRKKVRRPREVAPGQDVAAVPASGFEDRDVLLTALRSLTPRMRVVVVLRYWEDLSVEQTADLLGCSTGTVKSTASRGLERLRTLLDAQGVH